MLTPVRRSDGRTATISGMSFRTRLAAIFTAPVRSSTIALAAAPDRLAPTWEAAYRSWDQNAALSLTTVFRAVTIHTTAAKQLALDTYRGTTRIPEPALIRRPSMNMTRRAFIEYSVVSLYLDGAAFWLVTRDSFGQVIDLTPLDPNEVTVTIKRRADGRDEIQRAWRGKRTPAIEIVQLDLLRIPGRFRGLGPIAAARETVEGAIDARDYGASWLRKGTPDGILKSDQPLTRESVEGTRHVWYGRNPDGTDREDAAKRDPSERLRILGHGMSYTPLAIAPKDAQFIESQQFQTTEIARLFGIPPSMLIAAIEGSAQTYSNVEQEWIGYVRFGLINALGEIEEALSNLLPGRQEVRFRIDSLARADRKTRFEGHQIAIAAGFQTINEVREIEGLDPLAEQSAPEPAPVQEDAA